MNNDSFKGLGINPQVLGALERLGFTKPTPIQAKAIPSVLEGKDMIGIAQTGTGKTLAFGVPMIEHFLDNKDGAGLVVLPTRELAIQVQESLRSIGREFGIKVTIIIGGAPMRRQIAEIQNQPHIIVGTPGRIIDHLEQKTLSLSKVSILVLDEADRMLDMGFAPQLKRILQSVPKERQTLLFSATMPAEIATIARTFMKTPLQVEIAPPGTAAANVVQEVYMVAGRQKPEMLNKFLYEYHGPVLVFTRTKYGARNLARDIRNIGESAVEMHSNRTLGQRREALDGFKSGKYRVLVATDIAARGIDVSGIELVVNYDLPEQAEDYVHRIGRTGRAGESGRAVSFATFDQVGEIRAIEKLLRKPLTIANLSGPLPEVAEAPRKRGRGGRGRNSGRNKQQSFHGRGGRSGGERGSHQSSGRRKHSRGYSHGGY